MINDEELLNELRQRMQKAPSGQLLAEYIIKKKTLDLAQSDAKEVLAKLMHEYQEIPKTVTSAESVAGVLDRVGGW